MSQISPAVPPTAATPSHGLSCASTRKIIHVDMDAFFASVEQMDNPALKGRPVAVGGDPAGRGVVSAASYEARPFGVRSAMPMRQAVKLCPDLVWVRPRIGRYAEVSREINAVMRRFSYFVEPLSLDEAYLDVSTATSPASEVAALLKAEIRAQVGLTASAGVGPNKLVAKIASDLGKPDGLVVVRPGQVERFLSPLPVRRLWGVGPVTEQKLASLGIKTIGDMAIADQKRVAASLGSVAAVLIGMSRGRDDRPVSSERKTRSISTERTLDEDTRDINVLNHLIGRFATELEHALADEKLMARTVVLKLRYSDFKSVTRSRTLSTPFDAAGIIQDEALRLLPLTAAGRRKVRLIGLALSGFVEPGEPAQRALFDERGASC